MISLLLTVLLQEPPPPPRPRPRPPAGEEDPVYKRDAVEQAPPPRSQEVERLRRELEALPPDSPVRPLKEDELRRLEEGGKPRRPVVPARPPAGPPNLEDVREWLKVHEPETWRRVERTSEEGRRSEALRLLAEAEPRMREMAELKNRDPKAFEKAQELRRLESESHAIAERARGASPADREAAAKKLRESLDRLFDLREEQKARELDELKRRVADIEKQLEARKASKDRIVDRRKRELLGERLQDDW